jgi:drug/metabolite transporter (DMT)-like permease
LAVPFEAERRAVVLMVASSLLFAAMNMLARLAAASASWSSVAGTRAFVGAFVAFGVARARGRSLAVRDVRAILLRSVLGTASMILSFRALTSRSVALGDTVTLLNLSPVFVALLAPLLLRERTTRRTAIAIGVSFLGAALVVRTGGNPSPAIAGPTAAATIATAVGAACCSSLAMILLRRVGQTESPEAIALHFSLLAGLSMAVLTVFDARVPTLRDAICMLLAGVAGGFAQLAMTRAYALAAAAKVGSLSYTAVVASMALGALVLGERPAPLALLGTGLVIAGGMLVTFARR